MDIDHKRVKLCYNCYKIKRKEDWERAHLKRMRDPKYAKDRFEKQSGYIHNWKCNNRTRVNELSLAWKKINPNKVSKLKKEWYEQNKEKVKKKDAQRHLEKYNKDIEYKLKHLLRSRLNKAIKGDYKSGSAVNDLGCSIEELKKHLESKFKRDMSWDNYGEWHIDHIKPLASFDLTDKQQFKEACHYSNLQPLWSKDNLSKGAK